ncbi:MAG TPA: hypothetical protein VEA80_16675 [Vitreimonas sp.]|uniref:hypothetical protein n=1 Tax=Vitreimonas sp. TaxID=3069702 RepID=UPI002D719C2A|nr:hypothetical protein [Vitreimonas sp.]HYD89114.1 hypothetical protein [Vitreimonas sp.]
MTKRRSSLTGSWSGAYRYPRDAGPETVFNVQIEEVGGAFTGAMQEPNTFAPSAAPVLTAEIEGVRTGLSLAFTKFYDGSGGVTHAVRYEGAADAELMRIEGTWRIPHAGSGTFFMVRDDDGAAAEAEEEAKVEIGLRR